MIRGLDDVEDVFGQVNGNSSTIVDCNNSMSSTQATVDSSYAGIILPVVTEGIKLVVRSLLK